MQEQCLLYSPDAGVSMYKAVSSSLPPHGGNIIGTPQIALLQRIMLFFLKCLPALLQYRHSKQLPSVMLWPVKHLAKTTSALQDLFMIQHFENNDKLHVIKAGK